MVKLRFESSLMPLVCIFIVCVYEREREREMSERVYINIVCISVCDWWVPTAIIAMKNT